STAIKNAYRSSMKTNTPENLPAFLNKTDAYRAYLKDQDYTWGSNTTKSRQGIMFNNMITYKLDTAVNASYREAALGFINYFNGINPTAFCYLTNMSSVGAENSINEIYHSWFADGSSLWDRVGTSTYGPAPGFVSGGVNPSYALDGCCPSGCNPQNALCNTSLVTPPLGQPIQKSYRDWNTSWPQNSWTITEPGIYTQAAYVRLISQFVSSSSPLVIKTVIEGFYNSSLNKMNIKDTVRIYARNITAPYSVVDSSKSVSDSVTFDGSYLFPNLTSGTYYFAVRHRNSIETWSKTGGEIFSAGIAFNYNFTNDSSKAYGSNEVRVDLTPLTYAVYSGDVNQDGAVDASDLVLINNDQTVFASGYLASDINGDSFTDAGDLVIAFNNTVSFVSKITP
ncbi:MAG: glycoside hydrolase family 9 protein, partial [bacterium]